MLQLLSKLKDQFKWQAEEAIMTQAAFRGLQWQIKKCYWNANLFPIEMLSFLCYQYIMPIYNLQLFMFKFIEEHVLGMIPKRKTYLYRKIENALLSKLKDQFKWQAEEANDPGSIPRFIVVDKEVLVECQSLSSQARDA